VLHFLCCFSGALLIHHFIESHDVIKEKGGHVKYPCSIRFASILPRG
jgi:hypothetical protein